MLFLIITWFILGSLCLLIGLGLLDRFQITTWTHRGDRIILSLWLGLNLLSLSLLTISFFLPLSPPILLITSAVLISITCRSQFFKQLIPPKLPFLPPLTLIPLTLSLLVYAALLAQPITAYDTGLYHYPVIKWLSEYGTVPGLGLIHYTFGYPSAWLALSGAINGGFWSDRAATVTGGLAFLLSISQALLCSRRILQNKHQLSDWFFVLAAFLVLPILAWFGLPVSPSPDVPIIGLSLVIPWSVLTLAQTRPKPRSHPFDVYFIPVFLALGAFSYKLSALPLLFIAFCFFAFFPPYQLKRILLGAFTTLLLLIPVLAFGIITTGCPLYPAALFCLDALPWSVGTEKTQAMSDSIKECARWTCPPDPAPNTPSSAWIFHWIKQQKQAVFLIFSSLLALIGLKTLPRPIPGQSYLIVLGLLGSAFVLYGSPSVRIGMMYFYVPTALVLAYYCHQRHKLAVLSLGAIALTANLWLQPSTTLVLILLLTLSFSLAWWYFAPVLKASFFLGALLFLSMAITVRLYFTFYTFNLAWQLPPPIQPLNPSPFIPQKAEDFTYYTPDPEVLWLNPKIGKKSPEDRCWNAPLPCTPELTHPQIRLLQPRQGIQGGFVKNKP